MTEIRILDKTFLAYSASGYGLAISELKHEVFDK